MEAKKPAPKMFQWSVRGKDIVLLVVKEDGGTVELNPGDRIAIRVLKDETLMVQNNTKPGESPKPPLAPPLEIAPGLDPTGLTARLRLLADAMDKLWGGAPMDESYLALRQAVFKGLLTIVIEDEDPAATIRRLGTILAEY